MPPKKKNQDPDATRLYHIGCDIQGPAQTYHLGGQALTYITERLQGKGSTRVMHQGSVVLLREDQRERIIEESKRHVVRRGKIIDAASPNYRRQRGDYPVGVHCYIVPTEDTRAPMAGDDAEPLPPRIVKDREDWTPPTREMDPELMEEQRRAEIQAKAMAEAMAAAGLRAPDKS